ncbi:MAG: sulfatase-like hydrolase/transferase [Clostridiales bacterium]|uniref:LTA synthase family protein n=1 Tax=Clostridium sp. N3C TaxID=1776758 RepID=UPI00092DEFEE|nr:alkaline phosphatase family protein [Clostridium sp. N3C]NLZ48385.1 sulfatase-like hydrolase/transferase [Clostridiales bacterium]SCN24556.1 Phosphoglycerol transferase, alkaline phosphatase superfamily [Clostridium sp. N3C]
MFTKFRSFVFNNCRNFSFKKIKQSKLAKAILISFVFALITTFFLQFFQMSQNFMPTIWWISENYKIFLLSSLFIFCLYLLLFSIIGNPYVSSIIALVILELIGYSNSKKISILGEPLYPVDFYQIKNVKSLVQMVGGNLLILLIAATVVFILLLVFAVKKLPKVKIGAKSRLALFTLSSFIIYCYLFFSHSFINVLAANAGVNIVLWNQPRNYEYNGFVFGLLSNLQNDIMKEPEGYSEETIQEIVDKYTEKAIEINKERSTNSSEIQPNIITFMDETFWDPTTLEAVTFSEDPMSALRDVMANSSSGWMLSPGFGGNTANIEFEVLTGLSMYNLNPGSIPYQQAFDTKSFFPSLVNMLEERNYDTLAIHPYKKQFYKRNKVYSAMGFNNFIGEDDLISLNRLSENAYVSDQSVVTEILDKLQNNDSPMFIHAVTMQNHSPIEEGKHGENSITVEGLTGEAKDQMEIYAEGIKQSSIAVRNLIDTLEQMEEPTVVIFFGDHLPSFKSDLYEQAGYDSETFDSQRLKWQTPLFIYSNFDMKKINLNTMSPAFFGVTLYDLLNQPVTPQYAMLEEIKKTFPGLKPNMIIDAQDNIKTTELSEEEKALLEDYMLIQYDLLKGQQYSQELFFKVPTEDQ